METKGSNETASSSLLPRWQRIGYACLGCVFVLLGFIGAFLPVMPTTVFLIVAAWAFGKSSPRLERWLLEHPKFGPVLVAWRQSGAMPRYAKYAACGGITLGYILFFLGAQPGWWLGGSVFVFMFAIAIWIVLRPEPQE